MGVAGELGLGPAKASHTPFTTACGYHRNPVTWYSFALNFNLLFNNLGHFFLHCKWLTFQNLKFIFEIRVDFSGGMLAVWQIGKLLGISSCVWITDLGDTLQRITVPGVCGCQGVAPEVAWATSSPLHWLWWQELEMWV